MKTYRESIEEINKRGEIEVHLSNSREEDGFGYYDGYRRAIKDIKGLARENKNQAISIEQLEFLFKCDPKNEPLTEVD